MSACEQALIAAGIDPEQAARDAWADTLQMWRNREHPSYGKDPADWDEVRQAADLKYGPPRAA